jgi:hypothetical protein
MRLLAGMVLTLLAGSSHAQSTNPSSAVKPSTVAPAALDSASQKKLDDASSERNRKLADEKLARTEAQWKKSLGSICTGCLPRH